MLARLRFALIFSMVSYKHFLSSFDNPSVTISIFFFMLFLLSSKFGLPSSDRREPPGRWRPCWPFRLISLDRGLIPHLSSVLSGACPCMDTLSFHTLSSHISYTPRMSFSNSFCLQILLWSYTFTSKYFWLAIISVQVAILHGRPFWPFRLNAFPRKRTPARNLC